MSSEANAESKDNRPECRYGMNCYRRNPDHIAKFRHPDNHSAPKDTSKTKRTHSPESAIFTSTSSTMPKNPKAENSDDESSPPKKQRSTDQNSGHAAFVASSSQEFGFYLLSVRGIKSEWNGPMMAKDLKDILSMDADDLVSSVQFNYMFEIPWLISKYPTNVRHRPMLIVTSARNHTESADLRADALNCNEKNGTAITLALARLPIAYGTHHTKMMILKYNSGIRIVLHTANMIEEDWDQKTQGIYITPLLPRAESSPDQSSEKDCFKDDLIAYLQAYNLPALNSVATELSMYDMSSVKVKLVGSVPGRFVGGEMTKWGHGKLRALLRKYIPSSQVSSDWPAVAQFSSIGSLGPTADQWLMKEFRESLFAVRGESAGQKASLNLIFPTVENVRTSLEGYAAGGSLPYSTENASKQKYLKNYFHQWRSECRGRTRASPHIKTYFRVSPCWKKLCWFLLTSANLSKAAWGAYEKNGSQLMIRSYELGVLFLPEAWGKSYFDIQSSNATGATGSLYFPVPYDLPLLPYGDDDEPWVSNVQYRQKLDVHGRFWG